MITGNLNVLKYDLITPCADYRATVLCIVYTMYSTRPQPRRLQIYCSTPYTCTVLSLRNDLTELMTFQRTALIDAPVKWSVRRTYVESQKYTWNVPSTVYRIRYVNVACYQVRLLNVSISCRHRAHRSVSILPWW